MKKNIGILLLTFGLFTAVYCFSELTAHGQIQQSLFEKVQEQDNLNPIFFEEGPYWQFYNLQEFRGNSLDSYGHITPQTSELILTRNGLSKNRYNVMVEDINNFQIVATTTFATNSTEARFEVGEGTFKEGHRYQVYVNNDVSGPVATFDVRKSSEKPSIKASSRTVKKDDPNFDIMEGVTAQDHNGNDITSDVHVEGEVNIHKVGIYPITYSVTEKNGESNSISVEITVEEGTLPITPPQLDEVTDSDTTITGTGLPGTHVYAVLGIKSATYKTLVKENGTFNINLEQPYPAGTSITAYSENDQGEKSIEVYGVVQTGEITVGVNQILSSDTSVTGYTKPGAQLEVAVNNSFISRLPRDHLFHGTADDTGKYIVDMQGFSYPAGTNVVVTATLNGKSSSKSVIIYPKKVSIRTALAGDEVIYGKADSNAVVNLSVNAEKYQTKADAAGNFSVNLTKALISGDRVLATQISNDIESEASILYIY